MFVTVEVHCILDREMRIKRIYLSDSLASARNDKEKKHSKTKKEKH